MKIPRYSRYDKIIHLVLLLPYGVLINWLLFGKRYFTENGLFWKTTSIMLLTGIVLFLMITLFAITVREQLPHYHNSLFRSLVLLSLGFVITASAITILFFGYDYFHFLNYEIDLGSYYLALTATLAFNIISVLLNEGGDAMEKWKNVITESEELKKINLQSRLDGLKDQVNPHFLFNSLNSLSSLISVDPAKADIFLNEMSKVYRYLLCVNEECLTTLSSELQFIRSYHHLLKTRYNEGFDMEIKVEEALKEYKLPPLTLQLLVENAVKHNIILKETPLKISIYSRAPGFLVVQNNLQPKSVKLPSSHVGLSNIINKYRLLNQPEILVEKTGTEFRVIVPLLKEHHEIL